MQFEILQELCDYRENEGDGYLKPDEVLNRIKSRKLSVSHQKSRICWSLAQLESFGYLEVKVDSKFWARRYRVKSKYIDRFARSKSFSKQGGDDE